MNDDDHVAFALGYDISGRGNSSENITVPVHIQETLESEFDNSLADLQHHLYLRTSVNRWNIFYGFKWLKPVRPRRSKTVARRVKEAVLFFALMKGGQISCSVQVQ